MGTILPPEDLPDPGIKNVTPMSPELPADSLPTEPSGKPPNISIHVNINKYLLQKYFFFILVFFYFFTFTFLFFFNFILFLNFT